MLPSVSRAFLRTQTLPLSCRHMHLLSLSVLRIVRTEGLPSRSVLRNVRTECPPSHNRSLSKELSEQPEVTIRLSIPSSFNPSPLFTNFSFHDPHILLSSSRFSSFGSPTTSHQRQLIVSTLHQSPRSMVFEITSTESTRDFTTGPKQLAWNLKTRHATSQPFFQHADSERRQSFIKARDR